MSNGKNNWVEEFCSRFTAQAGIVHFAESVEEVVEIVNELIAREGKGDSCCSPLFLKKGVGGPDVDISRALRTSVNFADFQKRPKELASKLDVGITKAQYAIAETGSFVDISFSDANRLLSSISRLNIAVVESSCVLPKLVDLAPLIRGLLVSTTNDLPKPTITFIGGPSRTSDIELKSVLGVHGPHEVHIIILR